MSESHIVPVVFFDGVCGLCNRFVDFLIRRDRGGLFKLSPIQGELALRSLEENLRAEQAQSIILKDEQGLHQGSTAVLRILARLGGAWGVVSWLQAVPKFLRDPLYYWVARHRYRFFGKRQTCRLPTREECSRFLP